MELDAAGAADHGVGPDDAENIHRMIDNAAAAAGLDSSGTGLDTSIDDVLNAADMAVGNPEFLDLDMEGMF
jgi:mediator of RNA polymerase II transcription subunit 5